MKTKTAILISVISAFGIIAALGIYIYAPKYYFTYIVLPDTQKYSMYDPSLFIGQTNWIANNKKRLNIKFVSHLGDIVQSGNRQDKEWTGANRAFSVLDQTHIPYSVIPGNHDADVPDEPDSQFHKYDVIFPLERYKNRNWFGGNYQQFENNYQRISIFGMRFLIINLSVDPPDDILAWASGVINRFKHDRAILTTHAYLGDDGKLLPSPHFRKNGNSGEQIWEKLVKPHCSIFLVLSGHSHAYDGENRRTSVNNCGKQVMQVIQDYQDRNMYGNGLLRIFTFYPFRKTVSVSTYSTHTGLFENDEDSSFSFSYP